ncbi:MAG TPA: arginine deiminase family protein [Actinomycetota bacterium]|nr:arginine deiminase family protein [Actinomycetota bacterium]
MNGFGVLRKVLVRAPDPAALAAWRDYGWHAEPDPALARDEHEAFRAQLEACGAEVVVGTAPVPGDPDAMYAYDPTLVTDAGVIALRPGKPGRRGEPAAFVRDLDEAGVRLLGEIREPGMAEGGDMFFLDDATLLVGLGYRTNEAGVDQLRGHLAPHGVEIIAFDLPHLNGPAECLHLMSFISPLDRDLAVAYPPMMPVRLLQLLDDRGIRLVEVPEEEFPSMGPNVLALGPRIALALEGNPETRRRLEAAGVDVRIYRGEQISRNGDGGPTCLTRPLARG